MVLIKKIGGYFGLEQLVSDEYYKDLIPLNNGRNALLYLLKARNIKKLYIPYYLCNSVSDMCIRNCYEFEYYNVDIMKKILLLGGSTQQIPAIEYTKKQGYDTILCDYLPDNPGQNYADKFYCVSTTDKEAILEVAQKEKVDGVVAYASDPAAPTAAYVAEKMGLPTNPFKSVEILARKDLFRQFLKEKGLTVHCQIIFMI